MPRRAIVYIVCSVALSILTFLYYSNFHIHKMDPYPKELHGFSAYLASVLISFPVVHLLMRLRTPIGELSRRLRPTWKTVLVALVVLFLTPLGNLVLIPFPVGFFIVTGFASGRIPDVSSGGMLFLAVLVGFAYLITCLGRPTAARPWGALESIPLYLWTVYVAEILFSGIYYI